MGSTEQSRSQRRYPPELKERAVRMVFEVRAETGQKGGAVQRVAGQLGIGLESLRSWVNQAEVDGGHRPGTTTADAARIRELERARTAAAASSARAEAADQRAAQSEEAARREAERATGAEGEAVRVRAELVAARAGSQAAIVRAETAEALAAQVRADLAAERDRHDLGLAELRGQLAQLLALQPRPRRSTKAVGTSADTAGEVDGATSSG